MIKVKSVQPLDDYQLEVVFEDGAAKRCDIKPFLEIGAFQELKDIRLFRQVHTAGFSVEWPNELDLSSDTLLRI